MEKQESYLQDIASIRNMMERSTRFMSLSGLSGILIGLYALAGSYLVFTWVDYGSLSFNLTPVLEVRLIWLGIIILLMALITAVGLTLKTSRKKGQKIWSSLTRRLLIQLGIPLVAGGVVILYLLWQGPFYLIAPLSLVFYGLALINASKFTMPEVYKLGLAELVTGLVALFILNWSLLFWAFGFGILHIVYGSLMYKKYHS